MTTRDWLTLGGFALAFFALGFVVALWLIRPPAVFVDAMGYRAPSTADDRYVDQQRRPSYWAM